MDLTPAAKLVMLVLLGPAAALYDFATNPNAPPHIFVAQWNGSFPNHPIEPIEPIQHRHRIIVTRGI
jgi:hypothetical protein